MNKFLRWLLGTCVPGLGWHFTTTRPRRDKKGDYQRCLECGKRLPCTVEFGDWRPELERPSAIEREARETVPDDAVLPTKQWVNGGIMHDTIGSGSKDLVH